MKVSKIVHSLVFILFVSKRFIAECHSAASAKKQQSGQYLFVAPVQLVNRFQVYRPAGVGQLTEREWRVERKSHNYAAIKCPVVAAQS